MRALRRAATRIVAPNTLNAYERRVCSQNGEDGILQEIFRRIGTGRRFFVEFGVEDGRECNAAHLARNCDWSGVMIEGDAAQYARLNDNYRPFPAVRREHAFLTSENIDGVFRRCGIPLEFDLLSIDIDGNDYWMWEALAAFRPRVVVIEYNATRPPPERWVMRYNAEHRWARDGYMGASLASLEALGARLGYALLGTDENGVNAFFVREDFLAGSRFPRRSAAEAYHSTTYGFLRADGPAQAL
ncbi:MAG: hypothetical protein ABR591_08365 [Candidatus Velthaea sp.]